jgi:hypothetical protein
MAKIDYWRPSKVTEVSILEKGGIFLMETKALPHLID